jgi:hypothetical protein
LKAKKLHEKYIEFKLTDLPIDEFCLLLERNAQKELVEMAEAKISEKTGREYGKIKDLAKHLKNRCESFSKIKLESIWNQYIRLWKSSRMFIPIDCVIELCKLTNQDPEEIKRHIFKLKHITGKNHSSISFNFVYDEVIAGLGELIKCEGHLKKNLRQFSLENANVDLINHFKSLLKRLGVKNKYELLKVETDIPKKAIIRKVLINDKEIRFSTRFNKSGKRKVMFHDKFKYGTRKEYIIITDSNAIKVAVKIPLRSNITAESTYGISSSSIHIDVTNITLSKILHLLTNVPSGKKSKIIEFCPLLGASPLIVKREVINVIFASEGWLEENRIRIYLNSLGYVKDIYSLLKEFGMNPTLSNYNYLSINTWRDIEIFDKNFNLIVNDKELKLKEMISNKKNFKHGEGLSEILNFLKEKKSASVKEISSNFNKSKDDIWQHLKNGEKQNLIAKNTNFWPYRYSLTEGGESFLER